MLRRVTRAIVVGAVCTVAVLLPLSPASAAVAAVDYYGPYSGKGTCNYWRSAVAATGADVSSCSYYYQSGPEGLGAGWYFYVR